MRKSRCVEEPCANRTRRSVLGGGFVEGSKFDDSVGISLVPASSCISTPAKCRMRDFQISVVYNVCFFLTSEMGRIVFGGFCTFGVARWIDNREIVNHLALVKLLSHVFDLYDDNMTK